jgi:Mg-chelatase subunit ChlI
MDDSLADYIVALARATRESLRAEVGISTRAAIALQRAAKARAYLEGRDFCTPDDIKAMAVPVLPPHQTRRDVRIREQRHRPRSLGHRGNPQRRRRPGLNRFAAQARPQPPLTLIAWPVTQLV